LEQEGQQINESAYGLTEKGLLGLGTGYAITKPAPAGV
jgi:hypothetical protein